MMRESLFRLGERIWRSVPSAVRQSSRLTGVKSWIKARLTTHDLIYDSHYFAYRASWARTNAALVADAVVRRLQPRAIVDVGCATGDLLLAMRTLGVSGVGLEYSRVAVRECHRHGLDVLRFDLERDDLPDGIRADVFVCTEVAEHLPATAADRLVDLLCRASRAIVFTAAPPGQGGVDHVNEQPREYWIERFLARGFVEDAAMTAAFKADWEGTPISEFLPANLIVFAR